MSELLLDRAGRRRSPATMPGFHAGRPPRNKGLSYPADPPEVEETIAVMRAAGDGPHGRRAWSPPRSAPIYAGLRPQRQRVSALPRGHSERTYTRLAPRLGRGPVGGRRRGGLSCASARGDDGARSARMRWEQLQPWLDVRVSGSRTYAAGRISARR